MAITPTFALRLPSRPSAPRAAAAPASPDEAAPSVDPTTASTDPAGSPAAPTPALLAASAPARRGRLLRAEIAARLAMPLEGGASVGLAGILEHVARQLATRGPIG